MLVIGQFLKGYTKGISHKIIYEDVPEPVDIIRLCEDIFLVRDLGEEGLQLEELLVGKLFFLYRSPARMIEWTRIRQRRNWLLHRDRGYRRLELMHVVELLLPLLPLYVWYGVVLWHCQSNWTEIWITDDEVPWFMKHRISYLQAWERGEQIGGLEFWRHYVLTVTAWYSTCCVIIGYTKSTWMVFISMRGIFCRLEAYFLACAYACCIVSGEDFPLLATESTYIGKDC